MNYPLDDKWNLYLHYKDLGKMYNDNAEILMEIDNVVIFWQTFNNIPKTYEIFSDGKSIKKMKRNNATPCAYSFFRHGVFPCWEDDKNKNGFEFSVKNSVNLYKLEEEWMNSLVEIISNKNEIYKCINGVRIVDCTKFNSVLYRMEFWIDSEENKDEIEKILKSDTFGLKRYKFLYRSHKNMKETV
tara:strand:- start:140 stop:697 length:558 start_codon:yes stop_codon:yes gene_type:complete